MELKLRREHFLNHYPPFNLFKSGETERMFEKKPVHLYVHLPFCPTKCKYCYYKSFEDHSPQAIDAYLEDLKREITIYGRQPEVKNKIVKTMYFGGGTPSYLSYEQYTGLVRFLYDHFEFEEGFEFCSEARPSPDSISQDKLQMLKEMGVNRLSMGVQNLNNEILQLNGRDATKEFFHEVFHNAREIGFENINVDIMSGMLGETQENWQDVIQQLVNLGPESIAIYKMELFFNTKLFNEVRSKKHEGRVMTDNDEIEFIRYAHKRLKEEGYVVGNCLHLLKDRKYDHTHIMGVWNSEDMRAFGITSHSCCDEFFFQNTPNLDEYHRMLSENKLPIKRSHRLSIKDKLSQAMVYGMKRVRINRKDFCSRYGYDVTEIYGEKINQLVDQGILAMDEEELRITDDYQIFADDIARQFFLPEYASMMPAHLKRK